MDFLVINEQQRLLSLKILTQIVKIKKYILALETTQGKLAFIMKQMYVALTTNSRFSTFSGKSCSIV